MYMFQAQQVGNAGNDQGSVVDRGERDEANPIGKALDQFGGDRQTQAGFANAACPGERARRTSACCNRVQTAVTSCSRPISEVSCTGTFVT